MAPGLLAAAALMARVDRTAAAVTLLTAGVQGVALVTTDYPPAILRWMSVRAHTRVAAAHGTAVLALGLLAPGLSRPGRLRTEPESGVVHGSGTPLFQPDIDGSPAAGFAA